MFLRNKEDFYPQKSNAYLLGVRLTNLVQLNKLKKIILHEILDLTVKKT